MKKNILSLLLLIGGLFATAQAPADYYNSLKGKSGEELKSAVKALADQPTTVSYGDKTWTAFSTTDIISVNGRTAWYDMYSNILVYEATGHEGLNIEHSVPKSWWGGDKNNAYKDLYHLNPSNSDANNRKGNNPMGIVDNVDWTNGITTIGTPKGDAGGAKSVFEPADQFKGDFARAYFYVFTVYSDLSWLDEYDFMYDQSAYPTFKPWAYEMLLKWAQDDPVDSKEAARNEAVAKIQGNRNPFIDIPTLAEHIWGSASSAPLALEGNVNPPTVDRPVAPYFGEYNLTGLNTYSGTWWSPFTLTLDVPSGAKLHYSINNSAYTASDSNDITIEGAADDNEMITIRAIATEVKDGLTLNSPVATLVLSARNPEIDDKADYEWTRVKSASALDSETPYILVASKAARIMLNGTSTSKFMPASDAAIDVSGDSFTGLPANAAIIYLLDAGQNNWILSISDTKGNPSGCWTTSAAKSMSLTEDGTPASISFDSEGNAIISFGDPGTLQYNASSPRFLNYTSSQQGVMLYSGVKVKSPDTNVEQVIFDSIIRVEGNNIMAPSDTEVFSIGGMKVGKTDLSPGIYVVKGKNQTRKVIIK